jgi:hypothetical protein
VGERALRSDQLQLLEALRAALPSDAPDAAICLPRLVRGWLAEQPPAGTADADLLDGLCRQIDVRKKVATAYAAGFTRVEPETLAAPELLAALAGVLLASALSAERGSALKRANSALKALEAAAGTRHVPALRAWAWEVLDRRMEAGP